VKVIVVEPRERFLTADDFIAHIGPRTRLISTSLVRFDDGVRLDAARIARACHEAGALLLLDAAQCAGAMPIDVRALGADFVTGLGLQMAALALWHRIFLARAELIEHMRPGPFYWMALEDAERFHTLSTGVYKLAEGRGDGIRLKRRVSIILPRWRPRLHCSWHRRGNSVGTLPSPDRDDDRPLTARPLCVGKSCLRGRSRHVRLRGSAQTRKKPLNSLKNCAQLKSSSACGKGRCGFRRICTIPSAISIVC